MFDVKPGLHEGSEHLMLSLGPWRGGAEIFHVKPGPLVGSKRFMLSLGPSRRQNV